MTTPINGSVVPPFIPINPAAINPFADNTNPFEEEDSLPITRGPEIYEGVPEFSDDDAAPTLAKPYNTKTQGAPPKSPKLDGKKEVVILWDKNGEVPGNQNQQRKSETILFNNEDEDDVNRNAASSGGHTIIINSSADGNTGPIIREVYQPWDVRFYSRYCEVETRDVFFRILRTLLPYSIKFFDAIKDNPDFYGPFWISTTLIFALAACGNFASYINDSSAYAYEFGKVPFAALTIYGYMIVVPVVLWGSFKWFFVPLSLLQNICIYGYSLFIFIPAAFLCLIPFNNVAWAIMFVCGGWSTIFLVINYFRPLRMYCYESGGFSKSNFLVGTVHLCIIAVLHLGLTLLFKLYFFTYSTA